MLRPVRIGLHRQPADRLCEPCPARKMCPTFSQVSKTMEAMACHAGRYGQIINHPIANDREATMIDRRLVLGLMSAAAMAPESAFSQRGNAVLKHAKTST